MDAMLKQDLVVQMNEAAEQQAYAMTMIECADSDEARAAWQAVYDREARIINLCGESLGF